MRLSVNRALPLAALILLNGCVLGGGKSPQLPPPAKNGPAADYPMVIGDPFTIDGTTYTPVDKLNYDAVGYASVGEGDQAAVIGAHKILPLPSYVEVTSLASGKTILVRLQDRGPMSNDLLIELSAGAAAQLGITAGAKAPVRVRRVNPPEADRAMLRSGNQAPARMETPKPLLSVLMRKLRDQEPLARPAPAPTPTASPTAKASPQPSPEPSPEPSPAPKPTATPTPAPKPTDTPAPKPAASGNFVVQAAAFSTKERADKAATSLGGKVSKPGKYWLMRLGPFATKAEAEAALAKAKAAGYSDARVQRAD
ncbi:MAG: SPOR domain-containing protein [Novosphingobium sp.]|nr:SPOR domain-containing protein [Novosphingobium sp.]